MLIWVYYLCVLVCIKTRGRLQVLNHTSTSFEVSQLSTPAWLPSELWGILLSPPPIFLLVCWLGLHTGYHAWLLYDFQGPNLASASLTDPFPQPKGVQFLKPPSSASQLSTFSYWASRWACLFYLWSATQTFPSLVVLTTSIRPWVLLPASRWVVLANTTFLVRFLTMSSKAGQKYPSLHLGQAILQCRVVNIKVVGTWEGQKQSCKKLVSRELVMQTLRPQFRSLHSGSPSTAEAEAGGFLRLDGQTV